MRLSLVSLGTRLATHDSPAATMMTREDSGSFIVGSSGRTTPFSTIPGTAKGHRSRARCISMRDGATPEGGGGGVGGAEPTAAESG